MLCIASRVAISALTSASAAGTAAMRRFLILPLICLLLGALAGCDAVAVGVGQTIGNVVVDLGARAVVGGIEHAIRHGEEFETDEQEKQREEMERKQIAESKAKAAALYKNIRNAACGRAEDQFHLAVRYRSGGEPFQGEDYMEAYKWMRLSSIGGYAAAEQMTPTYANLLTADQISEAEKVIAEWKPLSAEQCIEEAGN